jgi:Outer membrane lipoprotein carrier protein LolA-like
MRLRILCSIAFSLAAHCVLPSSARAQESAPALSAKAPADAQALLRKMAEIPGLEAKFREEKKLALLKAPLVSEGRLFYKRGGYLARITEKPSPSTVRITPSALEVNNGDGFQRIDLRGRADIKLFVESFARVLAGDYAALSSLYTISFKPGSAPAERWTLTLVPKAGSLVHLVKSLELEGTGYAVQVIRVNETKGDSAATYVELVSAARSYTSDENQRLFGVGAAAP